MWRRGCSPFRWASKRTESLDSARFNQIANSRFYKNKIKRIYSERINVKENTGGWCCAYNFVWLCVGRVKYVHDTRVKSKPLTFSCLQTTLKLLSYLMTWVRGTLHRKKMQAAMRNTFKKHESMQRVQILLIVKLLTKWKARSNWLNKVAVTSSKRCTNRWLRGYHRDPLVLTWVPLSASVVLTRTWRRDQRLFQLHVAMILT